MTPEEKEQARAERQWRQFNVLPADVKHLHAAQGGKCAICGRPLELDSAGTVYDHNHKTGALRGMLCFLCNRALGLFGDNVERLLAAIRYLNAPPAPAAVGLIFGAIGRKAGSVPRNRKATFSRRGDANAGRGGINAQTVTYRCGCSDSGARPLKVCPVHAQPKV